MARFGNFHTKVCILLGVNSPFCSAIVLVKNRSPFPQGFWWFSRKKDPWVHNGEGAPREAASLHQWYDGSVHTHKKSGSLFTMVWKELTWKLPLEFYHHVLHEHLDSPGQVLRLAVLKDDPSAELDSRVAQSKR